MSKAKKHTPIQVSTEELAVQGQTLLSGQRYREAIEVYKQLLKRETRSDWREALAKAYLGRARDLAGKGMYQEAAALWENRANLCGESGEQALYLDWLLQAGQYAKAAKVFSQIGNALKDSETAQRLEGRLAIQLLADRGEIAKALPQDSALLRQQGVVREAVSAYSRGDEAAADALLKQIPFRSPYKDLRHLLKALLVLETDPRAAAELLDRVPSTSPFAHLAGLVKIGTLEGEPLYQALAGLDGPQQEFVAMLTGLDKTTLKLVGELKGLAERQDIQGLFHTLLANVRVLDRALVQRFCSALLPHVPRGIGGYEKAFGSLSRFERERIAALAAEVHRDLDEALSHWHTCADLVLGQEADKAIGQDDRLRAALIFRHMVELAERHGRDLTAPTFLEWLTQSLELDPDDKPSHLKLIGRYKSMPEKSGQKPYYRWVETAVSRFPEDSEVLLQATEAAVARRSFKKAAGYAQRLLRLDPINSTARRVLIQAHLSHARKLIAAGRFDLARQEFSEAAGLEREGMRSGVVQMGWGMMETLAGRAQEGDALIEQGLQLAGSGVLAHFKLAVESLRLKLSPQRQKAFQECLRENAKAGAGKSEVLALIGLVNGYLAEDVKGLDKVLGVLVAPLTAAAQESYSEEEMRAICDGWQRAGHHRLLETYATAALKRWKQSPVFVYYQVFARAKGASYRVSASDGDHLEQAYEDAQAQHDTRTARLIEEFRPFLPLGPFALPPKPQKVEREMLDLMELLGPEGLLEIMKRMGELPRELERDMRQVLEEIGPEALMEIMRQDIEATPGPQPLPKRTAKPRRRGNESGPGQGGLF
jgi:tetratricopeptide (TPR) repeat protein